MQLYITGLHPAGMLVLSSNLPAQAIAMAAVLHEAINAAKLYLLIYVHCIVVLMDAVLFALTPYFHLPGMMMSGETTAWWWATT